ncbi:MAG: GspH/FimT family pseudopilin [Aquabacterium sp.]|uniref:GspH/FimT family pseudopilin n=1 Tax=Aquabacterium sp. TaxID=1872578 RepID=UPI003BBB2AD4
MMTTHEKQRQPGWTLVELLCTLGILAIVAALATPSLQGWVARHTVTTQTSTLTSALRLARSEAIRRGQRVSLCAATGDPNSPRCQTRARDWSKGWLVFVDEGATPRQWDEGEQLIAVQDALRGVTITLPSNQASVSFTASGLALSDNSSFDVSPMIVSAATAHCVRVGTSGRIRIQETPCAS